MNRCDNCGRIKSKSAGCPDNCVRRKWWTKEELALGRRVSYNCTSKLLGLDILANETVRGEWFFTLDERPRDATYFGPYRSKEQADRVANTYDENWRKRLWYR